MNYTIYCNGQKIEPAGISKIYDGKTLIWEKMALPAFSIQEIGGVPEDLRLTASGILAPPILTQESKFYDMSLNELSFNFGAVSVSKSPYALTYYEPEYDDFGAITGFGPAQTYNDWKLRLVIGDRLVYSPGVNYNAIITADNSFNFSVERFRDGNSAFCNDGQDDGPYEESQTYSIHDAQLPELYYFSGNTYLYHDFPFKEREVSTPDNGGEGGEVSYNVSYQKGKSVVINSQLFLIAVSNDGKRKVFLKGTEIVLQNGNGGLIHLCNIPGGYKLKDIRARMANDIILIVYDKTLMLFNASSGEQIQPQFLDNADGYTITFDMAVGSKYNFITELVYGGGAYVFMAHSDGDETFVFYSRDGEKWVGKSAYEYTTKDGTKNTITKTEGGFLKYNVELFNYNSSATVQFPPIYEKASPSEIYSPGLGCLVYNNGFYFLGRGSDNRGTRLFRLNIDGGGQNA